jgi:thymidylate synthase ThyX
MTLPSFIKKVINFLRYKLLKHIVVELENGAKVIILDRGQLITAEDLAMLQALHSRDPGGILSHLKKVIKTGSGLFMGRYYVGYTHKSIGDCGTETIFIERVSMHAAKAVQDTMLYAGQEVSTRYVDFSTQPFLDPFENSLVDSEITSKLRKFYFNSLPKVIKYLTQQFPKVGEDKNYEGAIEARAFDILRGFLPAGATTNLAWTTNLRQFADRIEILRNHPLAEVRMIAGGLQKALEQAHPYSFGQKKYPATEAFVSEYMKNFYYTDYDSADRLKFGYVETDTVICLNRGIDLDILDVGLLELLMRRPSKTEIPKKVGIAGNSAYYFELDFASWRDIQRQRAVNQNMPLLSADFGFEDWYIDNLPLDLQSVARELLKEIEDKTIGLDPLKLQYLLPMGYKVPVVFSGDLPGLIYLVEIRASKMVHPTLQKRAIELGKLMREQYGLPIHFDENDLGRFDTRRGAQTITQK